MCLYAAPGVLALRREMVTRALAAAVGFTVLLLAFPISEAVELCMTWTFGRGRLSSAEASWAFALMASLYAALPAAIVSWVRNFDLSWADACGAAFLFAVLDRVSRGILYLGRVEHPD